MTEDISFTPAGPVRPRQIYVSHRLFKAIGYMAKAESCTREDVIERVIQIWLTEHYPQIGTYLDSAEAKEKEFLKALKETNNVARQT